MGDTADGLCLHGCRARLPARAAVPAPSSATTAGCGAWRARRGAVCCSAAISKANLERAHQTQSREPPMLPVNHPPCACAACASAAGRHARAHSTSQGGPLPQQSVARTCQTLANCRPSAGSGLSHPRLTHAPIWRGANSLHPAAGLRRLSSEPAMQAGPAGACRQGGCPPLLAALGSSSSSSRAAPRGPLRPCRTHRQRLAVCAVRKEQQAGLGRLEAAVPREQRPVNELQQLKDNVLCSWVRPTDGCGRQGTRLWGRGPAGGQARRSTLSPYGWLPPPAHIPAHLSCLPPCCNPGRPRWT